MVLANKHRDQLVALRFRNRSGHGFLYCSSQYNLKQGDYVERIYPAEKCRKARERVESKKCKKKKKKQTKKQREDCAKQRAINQSCYNVRLLRKRLILGCDSA